VEEEDDENIETQKINLGHLSRQSGTTNIKEAISQSKYIPLRVKHHTGGSFHATCHVSKLVTDDQHTFAPNYPGAFFIFEN